MERYGMFTTEGDQLVGRIVDAAVKAHDELGDSVQVQTHLSMHTSAHRTFTVVGARVL